MSISSSSLFFFFWFISACIMITACLTKLFQIKDDHKNGLFVENLTEEYVTSYEDVIQILIKVGDGYASFQIFRHA